MERFDVRATGPDVSFASLSGGNQQKAVLARELMSPGLAFLVAAQPTRGLDVGAVEAVYKLIREAYHLLGLQTYFTVGPKEARAWTVHKGDTAPQAAGDVPDHLHQVFRQA